MATILLENQLYLYALFSREVGVGRQTLLSRMEEVLLADGLQPSDLGCDDMRGLLEQLSDFVRLSVFKKGRVYATVLPQAEWDAILVRVDEEAEKQASEKKGSDKNAGKSWKRKRGKRELRPVKPKVKRKPKSAPTKEQKPTDGQQQAQEITSAAEDIAPQSATGTESAGASASLGAAKTEPTGADAPLESTDVKPADYNASGDVAETELAGSDASPGMAETEPVKTTVLPETAMEAGATQQVATKAANLSGAGAYTPASEQLTKGQGSPAEGPAPQANPESAQTILPSGATSEDAFAQTAQKAQTPQGQGPTGPAPNTGSAGDESFSAANRGKQRVPEPTPAPSITFNVTYNPYQGIEEDTTTQAELASNEVRPAAPPARPTSPATETMFPRDFAREVLVPNKELSALYQILPLDVDPMALLNEDWRVARSTEAYTREDASVVFPLRYFEEKTGERIQVTMRRIAATRSRKRWKVTAIDRVTDVGFEGLPAADNPTYREFAQFTTLGSWDELYGRLNELCGNGMLPLSADELRTYLPLTFRRVQNEGKFATIDTGADTSEKLGAFDTGLLAKNGGRILMCFETQDGDIPWRFVDFLTVEQSQASDAAPLPATYLHTLDDIAISAETNVQIDESLVQTHGARFKKAAQIALLRAQRDYRLAAPAYDPVGDVVRLLLPLCLKGANKPSHALVLCPAQDGDGFVASAVLSLQHAATCAKVVSFELPRWLG